jgi:hypothetical protein
MPLGGVVGGRLRGWELSRGAETSWKCPWADGSSTPFCKSGRSREQSAGGLEGEHPLVGQLRELHDGQAVTSVALALHAPAAAGRHHKLAFCAAHGRVALDVARAGADEVKENAGGSPPAASTNRRLRRQSRITSAAHRASSRYSQ